MVSLYLFILAGLAGGLIHFLQQVNYLFFWSLMANMVVLILVLIVLYAYSKLRMRIKLTEAIGLGDLLFFVVVGVSFPTVSFLMLFAVSLLFSLVLYVVLKPGLEDKTVPLAGLQSVFLTGVLLINMMFNVVNLYAF